MTPSNKKVKDMNWLEKANWVRMISQYPASTIMVFIRKKVGYRIINPTWFLILTLLMLICPVIVPQLAQPYRFVIVLYALAMFGLGHWQRWQRWQGICHNERWHSYSPGISYLEYLPLPQFFLFQYRVHRFLDPIAVLLIGSVFLFLSTALGLWIMISALFLFIHEEHCYQRMINLDLDIMDGMIDADERQKTAACFKNEQSIKAPPRGLQKTCGVPTGLAPDIARQVAERQAERDAANSLALEIK